MKVSTITSFSVTMAVLCVATTAKEAATPCPTTTITEPFYDEELGCWAISVEHDATYCIDGPICSGSGPTPAGTLCPVKGDVAIADCHSYLASYAGNDNCVLPVDATCQVIKTGAWGCVLSGSATPAPTSTCDGECNEPATPAPTKTTTPTTTTPCPSGQTPTPTKECTSGKCNETKTPTPTKECTSGKCDHTNPPNPPTPTQCTDGKCTNPPPTPVPCPDGKCTNPPPTPIPCADGECSSSGSGFGNDTISNVTTTDAAATSSSSGISAGVIGAIAAAAAVVAAVAGAAIYKQYTKKLSDEEAPESYRVDVVTP